MDSKATSMQTIVVTALAALLLQVMLAPAIAIASVVPNFMLVATAILAMRNNPLRATLIGFTLGLLFDLVTQGPFGCMTLLLTLLGYLVGSLNKGAFTGGLLVDMVTLLLAALMGELFNSIVYAVVGMNPEFFLSLAVKVLPGVLYDSICGLIVLLVFNFLVKDNHGQGGGPRGRSLQKKLN
jgi:rod shape-determining protein MreD